MEIKYRNKSIEKQCTDRKYARQLFGEDDGLVKALFSRINALNAAVTLKDIIVMPTFHFHKLHGNMEGLFAIDIKGRKSPWRIILEPLKKDNERFVPCNIDEIADFVRVIEIEEISKHYE